MNLPIVVLCGFLGSGKTTLLRRWRREASLHDAAVIVHDLSEFGLDAELIGGEESSPCAGQMTNRVAALHGRYARELLHESLGQTLDEICQLTPEPQTVLVESTGAARPWPLIAALTQTENYYLRHFIVTVDALNLHRDFDDGARLVNQDHPDMGLQAAAGILIEQVLFASVVALTKTDAIPKSRIAGMVKHIRQLNPQATVALSPQAGLLLEQLDTVPAPDVNRLEALAATLQLNLVDSSVTADEMDCLVFQDKRPFHPQRLWDVCRDRLETGIYRTKGFLWLASRPGHVLLWQQSGSQITLEFKGLWRAELLLDRESKLHPEEIAYLKERMQSEDPIFGDRHNELTLIGAKEALRSFLIAFTACLCTEEEILAWKNGDTFDDPWPKRFKPL